MTERLASEVDDGRHQEADGKERDQGYTSLCIYLDRANSAGTGRGEGHQNHDRVLELALSIDVTGGVPSAKLCRISPADYELRIVLGYRSQTLCCRSVDGVLVPRAYGDDLEDGVVGSAVEKPEPLGSSIRKVELDPGQARQVPADVARAEWLPGHSAVGEIVEDPLSRVDRRRVDFF
jgi:hypothetical protein